MTLLFKALSDEITPAASPVSRAFSDSDLHGRMHDSLGTFATFDVLVTA